MNNSRSLSFVFLIMAFFAFEPLSKGDIMYQVSLDTTFLGDNPYALDFQFLQGDQYSNVTNTATVTNSSPVFAPFTLEDGSALYGFPGYVSGVAEQIDDFTAGVPIVFDISLTENVDTETADGDSPPPPDLLSLYVCDQSLISCVTTNDPDFSDAVASFTESADPDNPGLTAVGFDTTGSHFNTTISLIAPVATPEPATFLFGALCLAAPVSRYWRGRRRSIL